MAKDLVDDLIERRRGVDANAVRRDVVPGLMPLHDAIAFGRYPAASLLIGTLVEATLKRRKIDFQDEHRVEQIDELREVPRSAAEERGRFALVGADGSYLVDVPDVVLVREALRRLTGLGITSVRKLAVAMDDVIAAPLQLIGH